jgi:hypothetical protein
MMEVNTLDKNCSNTNSRTPDKGILHPKIGVIEKGALNKVSTVALEIKEKQKVDEGGGRVGALGRNKEGNEAAWTHLNFNEAVEPSVSKAPDKDDDVTVKASNVSGKNKFGETRAKEEKMQCGEGKIVSRDNNKNRSSVPSHVQWQQQPRFVLEVRFANSLLLIFAQVSSLSNLSQRCNRTPRQRRRDRISKHLPKHLLHSQLLLRL